MARVPNEQYNVAEPGSLAVRLASAVRERMFQMFLAEFQPNQEDSVLDVGVTSDQSYSHSNYFEALYPYKDRITAVGMQEASFLQTQFPGVKFLLADALALPFADGSFDLVHSSAVLEHVGSRQNQARMIGECFRIARRGVCLTTPNRGYPIEFHTMLPMIHWLPAPIFRLIIRNLGYGVLAEEAHLNLVSERELRALVGAVSAWRFRLTSPRLFGLKSNLVLFAHQP
jgi:ubiquinone/menaquinone biosynthesis C-methylase UbiE